MSPFKVKGKMRQVSMFHTCRGDKVSSGKLSSMLQAPVEETRGDSL